MEIPHICRYCGGIVRLVPAESVYGDSAVRLGLKGEKLYQCQNCNARVGCHRGTVRPLGDLANEVLRLKRIETHQVFDAYWTERGMSRTQAYRWLAKKMHLPERKAHIGGFEMGNHPELQKGAKLYHVEKRMVKKDNVVFYLLDSFEVIQQKDAA